MQHSRRPRSHTGAHWSDQSGRRASAHQASRPDEGANLALRAQWQQSRVANWVIDGHCLVLATLVLLCLLARRLAWRQSEKFYAHL